MRDVTLCILIKKDGDSISELCLAMKKRGFGAGKWNGVGGKVDADSGETVEQAMVRETEEEISVKPLKYHKVAEIEFTFPDRADRDWDQKMHTYFATEWEGEPIESEEMKPQWFKPEMIPYENCWEADRYWIPEVVAGKYVKAEISFSEDQKLISKNIEITDIF